MNKKIPSLIFLINFLFLGLSPLWGAHVHHLHSHENDHNFSIECNNKPIINEIRRYCCLAHCTIESPFEHLFEKGIIFKSVKNFNPKNKQKSVLFYNCNNNKINLANEFSKSLIIDYIDSIKSIQISLKTSRSPPIHS